MQKGKLLLFFLVLTGLTSVVFGACTLDDPSCDMLSNSFNEFQIGENNDEVVLEEVLFYKKDSPLNKVQLERTNSNTFSQINPLLDSGVYELAMFLEDRSGISLNDGNPEIKEYRFSNLRPLPPIVPIMLDSQNSNIQIEGVTHFPNQIIEYDIEGNSKQTSSNSAGNFTLSETGLANGVHKLTLRVKDPSNQLLSAPLYRVVYIGYEHRGTLDTQASVSNINSMDAISYQRQVYVSGTASGGDYVLINGVKTPVISGEFGRFVNLNQGENTIEVGDQSVDVEFRNSRFHFLDIDLPNVVSGNSFTISGEVSQPLPFDIVVNGEIVETVSGSLSFQTQDIPVERVKNFVSLIGYNGEIYSEIVYQDSQNPQIELLNPIISNDEETLFVRVQDDIGFLSEQISFKVNNVDKSYSRVGDIYALNISSLNEGSHNIEVSLTDYLSNSINQNFGFEINSLTTSIISINNNQGNRIFFGDEIYLKEGSQKISIIPSEFVAFKSLRIDGKDIRDYEIKRNKYVEANLDVSNDEGILSMTFIDSNNNKYSEEIRYISDSEKPQIEFDYIQEPIRTSGEQVLLTGKIEDENFDWNSFRINGNAPRRYGEHFEVFVEASNTLNIIGNDLSGNSLLPSSVSSLTKVESSHPQYSPLISQVSESSFGGAFDSLEGQRIIKLSSYDGHLAYNSYLTNKDLLLSPYAREGVRSMNLKAISPGGKEFRVLETHSFDATPPTAKLYTQDNNLYYLIIDGTLSDVQIESILISGNPVSHSNCDYKLSPHSRCLEFEIEDDLQVQLSLSDEAGNQASFILPESSASALSDFEQMESDINIYFEGNDILVNSESSFIQGNIFSNRAVESIDSSHGNCEFDQESFVCMISLLPGENNVSITVEDDTGNSTTENKTIIRKEDFDVVLSQISGDQIYRIGDNYYYRGGDILANGTIEREAFLSVLVEGREIPAGMFNEGAFSVQANLDQDISGFDTKEIDVQIMAEDDVGNVAISEKIKLTYNRVLDAIISVIIS